VHRTLHNVPVLDFAHRHARQITLYFISGGIGALVEIGSYLLLLRTGMWYLAASVIAFLLSYITSFLLHKYLVFGRPEDFLKHLRRHAAVEGFNVFATNIVLFMLVEHLHVSAEWAKPITMGLGAMWNFVLFKFLVFV
jgi:putative flippase GtrA